MKHLFTLLVMAVFALGVGVGGLFSLALPGSQIDIESNTVTSRGLSFNTVEAGNTDTSAPLQSKALEQSFEMPVERISPGDWIKESSIEMRPDGVLIKFDNPQWAILADTNSMDPVFDAESHLIQKIPLSAAEITVGDIVSYDSPMGYPIVHRVVEIGNDAEGWYAILKGDNNPQPDPWKVRFEMVRRVTVVVVY